jgi:predicted adenine nucleotide alpha hydrolase (AANH) superfamily ATPase
MKKLLLHICCAPDATIGLERFPEEYEVEGFFYNPNIHPAEEYTKRLEAMARLAEQTGFPWREGDYDTERWFEEAAGLEKEPEKGKRCEVCIRLRLEQAAVVTREEEFDAFAAVLTVSPHKDAELVNRLGREAGKKYGVKYIPTDLKKEDGFRRSIELSREYGLYRQRYCGCIFSVRD